GSHKSHDAARKQWERLKFTFKVMGAPVRRERDGKEVFLILEAEAREYAMNVLNGLSKYAYKQGEVTVIAGSRFLEVDVEDVDAPDDWEPDARELQDMIESIRTCPIGLIHPVVLVGEVPPFELGLGRTRFAACKALGKKRVLARLVNVWDPIIACDEDQVRRHYGAADLEQLREIRDRRIAELRAAGKSNRLIAQELGVGEATVRRRSGASDDAPEQRTGADGKAYPAERLAQSAIALRRKEAQRLKEEEALTTREVAKRLGVSVGTAWADLNAPPSEEDEQGPASAAWHEIDPAHDPPQRCLAALEAGIVQLNAELREGTATLSRGRQVQRICLAITRRIRSGEFDVARPQAARTDVGRLGAASGKTAS
ncbi:MAG TPA: hypothetical protein DEA08_03330, partial [Planctomycetes bacterium]|nr:hypothetical protein [Planctomycetota bacterium]